MTPYPTHLFIVNALPIWQLTVDFHVCMRSRHEEFTDHRILGAFALFDRVVRMLGAFLT